MGESESPAVYHRWTALSILGALLGRNVYLPFGNSEIYPNMYVMLMGSAGARKGTAINPGRKLLRAAGYNTFAADAVSKEMLVEDMRELMRELLKNMPMRFLALESIS